MRLFNYVLTFNFNTNIIIKDNIDGVLFEGVARDFLETSHTLGNADNKKVLYSLIEVENNTVVLKIYVV